MKENRPPVFPATLWEEMKDCRWEFPNPTDASEEGLLAVGGDLSPTTLLCAYAKGIFPWTDHPITWWSPDPRTIFELERFHVPRRLERQIRSGPFRVTFDTCFRRIMEECARPVPGREETWISQRFIDGYSLLHQQGFAHSAECFHGETLVGGLYGIAIGGFFGGESMFSRVSGGSRMALTMLIRHLRERGFKLFDAQVPNPHLHFLGAVDIPRGEYLRRLKQAISLDVSFAEGAL
jgi:leucyl/phenylalanyl-tRNA--protein transferase